MDKWMDSFREQAERFIQLGYVREIEFSHATYQVEVYDPQAKESRWPFLQFDDHQKLKDAFCTCPSENGKCVHIAAALLKILNTHEIPLHVRFEHSFWNHLCYLFGEHCGFEERFLKKKAKGRYQYLNEVGFEIEAKTNQAKAYLTNLMEKRLRETPENSIKFSNLSQEEISRWREGRPGPELRYLLSFWSDLAKWMMQQEKSAEITFVEDEEGYPTLLGVKFPLVSVHFEIKKRDLPKLIPYLGSVNSPLKVFQSADEKIKSIRFDPKTVTFHIEHQVLEQGASMQQARSLESWLYLPGKGFYPKEGASLLKKSVIPKDEVPQFLEQFTELIALYIPIHEKAIPLNYTMYFDKNWDWHFTSYLLEKGDLLHPGSSLIGNWVFLSEKGFYRIEEPFFDHVQAVLEASKVSHFVNQHRIWLNGQEGFQTHLASIESRLSYTVTEAHLLRFHAKLYAESIDTMDFGDWIYYAGLGFFSKRHAKLGLVVRPGLEVRRAEVSSFIKANRDELEAIPRFFTTLCPLASNGLEITVESGTSLHVKPVYTLRAEYSSRDVHVFSDFVYLQGEGFYELPVEMRLPEAYLKPVTISQAALPLFLESELPLLIKYCQKIDPSLLTPHKLDLTVQYLARTAAGLKAQLYYQTEYGGVAITDLLDAVSNKKRFCFTEAGLIDLHGEAFQWLKNFKNSFYPESKSVELSTLDLIKLDATFGLLGPSTDTATAHITRNLLKELREFISHETPNIKGLVSSLRLYQQTGLQWLWFLYRNGLSGLLCDDMGLGKTHQAMALIAASLNQKTERPKRFLVVCPTSVIYHWQDKLETFLPHIKVHTFHGLKRTFKDIPKEGLLLTSYGILRMEKKRFEELTFELAIFDEIQVAKNPKSRVHEVLKTVRAGMRIGLTGTPIENNLLELKSLFDIVLPGYMPSEARYRELFIQPIERDANEEKKALLSQMIRPFILRRRKTEVLQELPEKSEDKSYCDLSEEQIKLYKQTLAKTSESLISDLRNQSQPVNYVHIFSLLSQLKQICDHPALIYKDPKNYKNYASGKWELFIELLEEARQSEQKVVVFSQYLYMLDIIENYLKEKGWQFAQIRGDTLNRREEMKRFQEDPNCLVFIGSLQAAGLGIDLTAASVVIMYDRWWNAARENQAIDRVHRIGQKWKVMVYKLITKETIEEKIDRMITRKGRLLEEVVAADDQEVLKKFTRSELIELFSFHETL